MIVKSIRLQNFRCVKDETLPCENLTVLVGSNGSGKSTFLRALEIFYNPNAAYSEDDFYAEDTSQKILITIAFSNLTAEEEKLFKIYVENGEITVEKELVWPPAKGSQKYYGTSLVNPDFKLFREARGENLRKEYNTLRAASKYSSLPTYTNKEEAEKALQEWEQSNPDQCKRERDGGQFFGFKEVGKANLERHTKFIIVRAVRDASEDVREKRGSVITEIMDLVVRTALAQRKDIADFQEQFNKQYEAIFDPSNTPELQQLEKTLSGLLKTYAPDTEVKLDWNRKTGLEMPMPEAEVRLVEDEYHSPVSYTGHGVQRSFILAMLQYLALAEAPAPQQPEATEGEPKIKAPNLIFGVEEPELYQHPDRQRYLSKALNKLAKEGILGVVEKVQVIYSTHSPLFVDLEQFERIRVFRKVKKDAALPKQTEIRRTTLAEVAQILEKISNKPPGTYTGETLRARLRGLLSPWVNEGFFARLVVLVEGIKDRAAILGAALAMGTDLESKGASVIPCGSKSCLDRATAIFSSFGILTYTIWDSDYQKKKGHKETNKRLLRLFNEPEEDWPEKIADRFACFKQNLKHSLMNELGDFFDDTLQACCDSLEIDDSEYAIENPVTYRYIFEEAKKQGKSSPTMEKIISKIVSSIPS